uniref:Uncharacterized protein LOC114345692 n=1 Tax=Diabrotica virgifera virgifera TaxID=50390 RepID=A0A6P7H8P1_DIAVI
MNFSSWIFFCLTFVICISTTLQAYIGEAPQCYGSQCPAGTTRCKKHMKSQQNGYLHITINCLDAYGGSLKEFYFENPSTLNPNTKYESTSYSDIGSVNPYVQTNFGNSDYRNNEAADLMGYGY